MLAGVTIVDPQTTWIEPGRRARAGHDHPAVHRAPGHDECRDRRGDRPARRRGRHRGRTRCAGRAVLLPSPRNRPGGRSQGGHVRGDQELAHRRAHEGAAPVVHRRRRDRRGHEYRGGKHHCELSAPGRPAERPDENRPQRQDRGPQCLRCAGRDWRRCLDRGGIGHHRRCPSGCRSRSRARGRRTRKATSGEGESRMAEATLPGLETVEPVLPVAERKPWIERGPQKRLMLFSGRSNPELAERIAERLSVTLGEVELKTFANGETYVPLPRVDPRRRRLHHPVGQPARERPPRRAPDHDPGGEAGLGEADHRGRPVVPVLAAGQEIARRASRSRPGSSRTRSRPPASTASSRWTSTPARSRVSSTSRSTT